jgi:hypothetical protein
MAARHQPVRLPPAAGRARRTGQQRAAGPAPGLQADARFGEQDLGFIGPADWPSRRWHKPQALGREPVLLPGDGRPLRRVAWCTGGAQGYFEAAIAAGADAFMTGEISEPQAHWRARPAWPSWPAATTPPNATARRPWPPSGAQFGLEHRFIDMDNPA